MDTSSILSKIKAGNFNVYELAPLIGDDTDLDELIHEIRLNYSFLEEPLFYYLLYKNPKYIDKLSLQVLYNLYPLHHRSKRKNICKYIDRLKEITQDIFLSIKKPIIFSEAFYKHLRFLVLHNNKVIFCPSVNKIFISDIDKYVLKDILEGNFCIVITDMSPLTTIYFEYIRSDNPIDNRDIFLTVSSQAPYQIKIEFKSENEQKYYYDYVGGFEKLKYTPMVLVYENIKSFDSLLDIVKQLKGV